MAIIEAAFWKYVWPFLWLGATGTGIKLYIREGGVLDVSFSNPVSSNPPTVGESYLQKLTSQGLTPVTDNTTESVLQNILRQRMYPHYHANFTYNAGQIFTGSKAFTLSGKEYKTTDGKKLFIFEKNQKTDTDNLKNECKTALSASYQETTDSAGKATPNPQYYKLKEWCTEPKIKAVLARHKLHLLDTDETKTENDEKWKEIIGGGWFKNEYKDQQTFISSSELSSFLGNKANTGINSTTDVEDSHIKQLKQKCKSVLDKVFERNSFPASKAFLDKLSEADKKTFPSVDEFREAAIFCSEAKTAKDYIDQAMHGMPRTTLPNDMNEDFCLVSDKTITDYESIKTHDPFGGKSFWCAVRILYEKHKEHSHK